ncbi:MAG: hypothetical protein M0P30_05410 [Syntrophorhabdaceae bacterium]|nr:hypothetical protein [Syntrophorhabdaceae bacterium]
METIKNVQLNLSIPEHYRNLLRKMAAERVLNDPTQVTTGASIATELLLKALQEVSPKMNMDGGTEND